MLQVIVNLTTLGTCEEAQNRFEPQTDTVSGSLKTGKVPPLKGCSFFFVDSNFKTSNLCLNARILTSSHQRDGEILVEEAAFISQRNGKTRNSRK